MVIRGAVAAALALAQGERDRATTLVTETTIAYTRTGFAWPRYLDSSERFGRLISANVSAKRFGAHFEHGSTTVGLL